MARKKARRNHEKKDGLIAIAACAVIVGAVAIDSHYESKRFDSQDESVVDPAHEAMMRSIRDPLVYGTQDEQRTVREQPTDDIRPSPFEGITVVLDAGHGMSNRSNGVYDPGAVQGEVYESHIVLDQALRVGEILKTRGFNVVYTRSDENSDINLENRSRVANEANADIFVSLHCNSFSDPSAEGVRVYHHPGSSKGLNLARLIGGSLVEELSDDVSGFNQTYESARSGDFSVLLRTRMPAVLVESGFLTNARDIAYLTGNAESVAEGIADGIVEYFSDNDN